MKKHPIEELNIFLVRIRKKIEEREKVIRLARKTLDDAIDTGSICQQCYPDDDEQLQGDLNSISEIYAETEMIIAEQKLAIERFRELEQIGERLRDIAIPATFAGGGE